jgi:hypothetical protein
MQGFLLVFPIWGGEISRGLRKLKFEKGYHKQAFSPFLRFNECQKAD